MDSYEGKTSSKVIRIGYIGQISQSKGIHLLIQAIESLQDDLGKKFRVSIYGNLEHQVNYSTQLRSMSAEMDNVQFCGIYPHDQSSIIFANLDVLVVPSLWYDFPLIIYEAFATKTPVIATNLGGMAEAVTHEINGLLFERDNVNDLARQLRRIIEEKDLLEQLKTGIPQVKRIEEEVDELEQIYNGLINHQTQQEIDGEVL
jgi:glycosyltransferase involved in cell wall biosynthesis